MLLIGGAVLLFLSKKSEAEGGIGGSSPTAAYAPVVSSVGTFPAGTKAQAIAQTAEVVLVTGTNIQSGIAAKTPTKTPETKEEALGQLAEALATGADLQATLQEAKLMASSIGPKSAATVASEIQQGIINPATGGLNAVWTGVGFYNPFTGVTHIPTVYA